MSCKNFVPSPAQLPLSVVAKRFPKVRKRRRVSLINYKGGSGRILGAKLNKKQGQSSSTKYFFTEFVRKIKKWMGRIEKNTKKKKRIKIQKNVFDQNFYENEFWGPKLQLSEFSADTKTWQNHLSTITFDISPQNPKTHWPFLHFSCARTDHSTWPIDRARSHLFISFFLGSLRPF